MGVAPTTSASRPDGDEVEITKHGRVVARLIPAGGPHSLKGKLTGTAMSERVPIELESQQHIGDRRVVPEIGCIHAGIRCDDDLVDDLAQRPQHTRRCPTPCGVKRKPGSNS